MAVTKEKLISDIELRLTQGVPSDDFEIEKEQIAFWINEHLNNLVRWEIIKEKEVGNQIPPIYIIRDVALELNEESVTDVDDENQRIYVDLNDLSSEILDLPRDGGIVRILDYDKNKIRITSSEDIDDIRNLRFAKPSQNNWVAYREGNTLVIEGINTADLDFNPIMISYVKKQDILSLDDTDEVLVSDMLLPILINTVVQTGKDQLLGSAPADQENDGTQKIAAVYHQQIRNQAAQQEQPSE